MDAAPIAGELDRLGRVADASLIASWVSMTEAVDGALGGVPGCRFASSGLPAAAFNGAMVGEPLDDPDAMLDQLAQFMGDQGVPYLLWCREGLDAGTVSAARRRGFTEAGGPPGMVMPVIEQVPDPPPGSTVEQICDDDGIERFRELMEIGFGLPRPFAEQIITERASASGDLHSVIVWAGDTPVSCALGCVSDSVVGIYNVATHPDHRGRGWGTTATWAAVKVGAERGCTMASLQSSDMGRSVYAAMGFIEVGRYIQLEAPTPG